MSSTSIYSSMCIMLLEWCLHRSCVIRTLQPVLRSPRVVPHLKFSILQPSTIKTNEYLSLDSVHASRRISFFVAPSIWFPREHLGYDPISCISTHRWWAAGVPQQQSSRRSRPRWFCHPILPNFKTPEVWTCTQAHTIQMDYCWISIYRWLHWPSPNSFPSVPSNP